MFSNFETFQKRFLASVGNRILQVLFSTSSANSFFAKTRGFGTVDRREFISKELFGAYSELLAVENDAQNLISLLDHPSFGH